MTTAEEKKQKKSEYNKEYGKINRDKIIAQKKGYNDKNRDKRCEYMKRYHQENKQKQIEWRINNKDKRIEYNKKNKDKINLQQRAYRQTEKGDKIYRIASWKYKGVISDDFDSLYEKYMNTNNCENCDIELVSGAGLSNKKHLDHDHRTNLFRNVLCGNCNINRKE